MVEKKKQEPPAVEPPATAEPAPPVEPPATAEPIDLEALKASLVAELVAELRGHVQAVAVVAEPPAVEPEPEPAVRYVLVLANGRQVEAPTTVATEHYDEETGLTVPVVSSFRVPAGV